MRWGLAVGRVAMAAFRQAGPEIGQALQEMATEDDPWINDLAIQTRPGRFDRNVAGYWITYQVDREGGTLRILSIQPNR